MRQAEGYLKKLTGFNSLSELKENANKNLLNPVFAIFVITIWMLVTIIILFVMGFSDSEFVKFGPSNTLIFLGIKINTWGKWSCVCLYTFINQLITTYGLETITPWMINIIQNREQTTIKNGKKQSLFVILLWYTYMWMSRIFGIQIFLSQMDIMILVLLTDLISTGYITKKYLDEKIVLRDESNSYNSL